MTISGQRDAAAGVLPACELAGLTAAEAAERLRRHGPDAVAAAPSESWLRALHDGEVRAALSDAIVVGDVLLIAAGEVVAADASLLRAQQLQIDEAGARRAATAARVRRVRGRCGPPTTTRRGPPFGAA